MIWTAKVQLFFHFFYFCGMNYQEENVIGFIFAAGLGTRLYPLTKDRPKALVRYEGVPLLERVVCKMADAGIHKIIVNVHHFPDMIMDFLRQHQFPAEVIVSDERAYLRDTAGGLRFATHLLGDCDHLLVHNVDIVSSISLQDFVAAHLHRHADATLAVKHRHTSRYLVFNKPDLTLCGWRNITTGETRGRVAGPTEDLAFSGIHMIRRSVVDKIPSVEKSSITDFYVKSASSLKIIGYEHDGDSWRDVGKYEECRNSLS